MYIYICIYIYIYTHIINVIHIFVPGTGGLRALERVEYWPLHDIVLTNIVWCIAYKREVGSGVVYYPIIVQSCCTRVGSAGGRGERKHG